MNKNLHEGLHQLQYWFNMQMTKWRKVKFRQDWLGEGLAEYFGSVAMTKKRELTFHGVNVPRLNMARRQRASMKKAGKELPIFPLNLLVQFNYYHQMQAWGGANFSEKARLFPKWRRSSASGLYRWWESARWRAAAHHA